jgi:hypothetical protein
LENPLHWPRLLTISRLKEILELCLLAVTISELELLSSFKHTPLALRSLSIKRGTKMILPSLPNRLLLKPRVRSTMLY